MRLPIKNHQAHGKPLIRRVSAAAGLCVGACRTTWGRVERHARSASIKNTVVLVEVSDKAEVRCKPRALQHEPGVAAHWKYLASRDVMVLVQNKAVWLTCDGMFASSLIAIKLIA